MLVKNLELTHINPGTAANILKKANYTESNAEEARP